MSEDWVGCGGVCVAGVVKRDVDFRKAYTLRFVNKAVGLELRPKN